MTMKVLPATLMTAVLATVAGAQTAPATKVGVIQFQNAIIGSKDGQKAAAELQARFDPKRKELEGKQSKIAGMQDTLNKGRNTMSADQREKLIRDIDDLTKSLNRDTEDANAEVQQAQQKIFQELGQRMMAVIDKYARDKGYTMILDVSSPQTPVLYVSSGYDVTQEVVSIYDKTSATPAPTAAPAARPASPAASPAPKKK